jgi:hypothetical protein
VSDAARELFEAAKAVLPFLKASTDDSELSALEYLERTSPPPCETTARRLQREADEIEAKDAVIERFRAAVAAFEGEQHDGR